MYQSVQVCVRVAQIFNFSKLGFGAITPSLFVDKIYIA